MFARALLLALSLAAATVSLERAAEARPRKAHHARKVAASPLTLVPDEASLEKASLHDRLVLVAPPAPPPKHEPSTRVMFLFATTLHVDDALRTVIEAPVHAVPIFGGGGIGGAVGGHLP